MLLSLILQTDPEYSCIAIYLCTQSSFHAARQEKHCHWLIRGHVFLIRFKYILKGMLLLLVLVLTACDQSMTNSGIISGRPKNTVSFGLKTMKTRGSSIIQPQAKRKGFSVTSQKNSAYNGGNGCRNYCPATKINQRKNW